MMEGTSSLQVIRSLGWIVPWTLVASIGTGMLLPMSNFLTLNFFAQKYTDLPPNEIACQLSTMAQTERLLFQSSVISEFHQNSIEFIRRIHKKIYPKQLRSIDISGTSPAYCQMALIDGNRLLTALAVAMPVCQFLTLPLVGVLSDAFGRKTLGLVCFYMSTFFVTTCNHNSLHFSTKSIVFKS